MDEKLRAAISELPPVDYAFAYGSAVYHQPGLYESHTAETSPLVDFIFAVEDPVTWHAEVGSRLQLLHRVNLLPTVVWTPPPAQHLLTSNTR
jgi:hypothetical protein